MERLREIQRANMKPKKARSLKCQTVKLNQAQSGSSNIDGLQAVCAQAVNPGYCLLVEGLLNNVCALTLRAEQSHSQHSIAQFIW